MLRILACCVLLGGLSGCGSSGTGKPQDFGGADANLIATLIDDVNENAGNAKRLAALYAAGSMPEDAKLFPLRSYYIMGKPSITGAEATAKVRVDDGSAKQLGEVTWTFAKDGDKWKLKSTPTK